MKKTYTLPLALLVIVVCLLTASSSRCGDVASRKLPLRVLYVGHSDTSREGDFTAFLGKHFTKVGKGTLDNFKEEDARDFDVVILDYSGLTIKDNAILMPNRPFGDRYERPTVTVGAAGALVCDSLGLKTGYL